MRVTPFGLVWAAQSISLGGTVTSATLLPLLAVVRFDASPAWLGAFMALTWLPQLIIGLPAGAWIDTWCPRRTTQTAALFAAAFMGSIPLGWVQGWLTLTHLLVVAAGVGTCAVFIRTAQPALVMRVVEPSDLMQANSRIFSTDQSVTVAGPGIAGALVATVGAAIGVILDVVTYLVCWVCLWRVKLRPQQSSAVHPVAGNHVRSGGGARVLPATSLAQRVVEGIRIVAHDSYLRYFSLAAALANLGMMGFVSLQVLYLKNDAGLAPGLIGAVLMVEGAGGVIGAFIAPYVARRLGDCRANVVLSLLGIPAALLIPLVSPGWGVLTVIGGMIIVNISISGVNVIRSAFKQHYVPVDLMGRVGTAGAFLSCLAMVVAGVLASALGTVLGVRGAIAAMLVFYIAGTGGVWFTSMRTQKTFPTASLRDVIGEAAASPASARAESSPRPHTPTAVDPARPLRRTA